MRGLILASWVAIFCLSVASSTSIYETCYTKFFDFGEKDVLQSLVPFSKSGEIVYAVNEGTDADRKWKVYMESSNPEENIPAGSARSCDVDLKYDDKYYFDVALFNAGKAKAIFVVRDGDSKVKLMSVNMNGCQIKEASIDMSKNDPITRVVVLPRENSYDVIFPNKQLCRDFLCKTTFDYEGKAVQEVSDFLATDGDLTLEQIEATNDAYLAIASYDEATKVYLIQDEDKKRNTLLSGPRDRVIGLSAEDNKLTYCAQIDGNMQCKQLYDAEDRSKEMEFKTGIDDADKELVTVLNVEEGLILLWVENQNEERKSFVAIFDQQGKRIKLFNTDLKCSQPNIAFPKLYRKPSEYCVTSICLDVSNSTSIGNKFTLNSICASKTKLFN